MLKLFNNTDDLIKVLEYIKEVRDSPRIILIDNHVFFNEKNNKRSSSKMFYHTYENLLNDNLTLEFLVFDKNINYNEMETNFKINQMLDPVYDNSFTNKIFFENNEHYFKRINNICFVDERLGKTKNDLIKEYLMLNPYVEKVFSNEINSFILFSNASELFDFITKYEINEKIHLILYPINIFYKDKYNEYFKDFCEKILKI